MWERIIFERWRLWDGFPIPPFFVIPAKAGIESIRQLTCPGIPAFAGMTM